MYEKVDMRDAFASILSDMMKEDERIIVMDADLGAAHATLGIRDEMPERYVDCGISEQAMVSVAGGLSAYGFIPVACTFTAFMARRANDQINISAVYAQQNVKLVGSDPGITAETNGGTHMSVEDIGALRSVPNLVICEPADNTQLAQLLPQIINYVGTVYMRMCRSAAVKPIFTDDEKFDLFKAYKMRDGADVSVFATSIMVEEAKAAVEELAEEGVDCELIAVHTIKPLDKETLVASAKKTGCVVTCENSNVIGGFQSAVLEALAEDPVPLKAIGIQDHFGEVGFIPGLKEKYGMTKEDIKKAVREIMEKK
jgi:transketolase